MMDGSSLTVVLVSYIWQYKLLENAILSPKCQLQLFDTYPPPAQISNSHGLLIRVLLWSNGYNVTISSQ